MPETEASSGRRKDAGNRSLSVVGGRKPNTEVWRVCVLLGDADREKTKGIAITRPAASRCLGNSLRNDPLEPGKLAAVCAAALNR